MIEAKSCEEIFIDLIKNKININECLNILDVVFLLIFCINIKIAILYRIMFNFINVTIKGNLLVIRVQETLLTNVNKWC